MFGSSGIRSEDKEKTGERVKAIWKASSREDKRRFLEEYGILENTMYRVCQKGAIIPKVVLSIGCCFDYDPYYLTGETDENEGWSEQTLERFLREKGYDKLLDDLNWKPKRKYTRRAASGQTGETETTETEAVPEPAPDADFSSTAGQDDPGCACKENKGEEPPRFDAKKDVSEDDLLLLLRALKLRAEHNSIAKAQLNSIIEILLS